RESPRASLNLSRQCPTLPRRCQRSTIGAGGLNFRVRNGNGCDPSAMVAGKLNETGTDYSTTNLESELETDPQGEPAHADFSTLNDIGVGGVVSCRRLDVRPAVDQLPRRSVTAGRSIWIQLQH